jgi:phosphomannomutase / phosphoglucomutase
MNDKPAAGPAARADTPRGRPLFFYELPLLLVALLALVGIVLAAGHLASARVNEAQLASARATVDAFAGRLAIEIEGRRRLAELAVADQAAAMLAAGDRDAVAVYERRLQGHVSGLVGARLLPADVGTPDDSGPVPLGYAGLDMIRRVVSARRTLPGEVHQVRSAQPYFALATPVMRDNSVVGVLFTGWDTRFLTAAVDSAPAMLGTVQLLQGGRDGIVVAGGEDGSVAANNRVDVAGSILELAFETGTEARRFDPLLFGVAGGALILLLVAAWLQSRLLARDLKADMATLVTLGEGILRRDMTLAALAPKVRDSASAIVLLGQMVRRAQVAVPGGIRQAQPSAPVAPGIVATGVEVSELDMDPNETFGVAASGSGPIELSPALFRAYDIRGVVGEGLDARFAERLGRAVGSLLIDQGGRRLAIARDARLSSPELCAALSRGLTSTGCDVVDLGLAPTPLLYFGIDAESLEAGVMVTGSHNPPDFNGFKIVIGDRVLDGDELQSLRRRMQKGQFAVGAGVAESVDLVADYVEAVTREVQLARSLKVVVDAGNGAAGQAASRPSRRWAARSCRCSVSRTGVSPITTRILRYRTTWPR